MGRIPLEYGSYPAGRDGLESTPRPERFVDAILSAYACLGEDTPLRCAPAPS